MPNIFDAIPATSNVFDDIPASATNGQPQVDDLIRRLLNPLSIAPTLGIHMPSQYGSSYIGPPVTQNTDEPTTMVAPKGKNPSDASNGSLPNFANLPGQLNLDPLQQVQMQSGMVDPENAGATLANLLHGNDDVFLQTVAPHITAAAHALSDNPVTRGIGYGLNFAGQAIKGDVEAVLENLFGGKVGSQLANQQLLATAAEMNPKWKGEMDKEGIDTSDPYQDARETLPVAERMASGVGPGLLQSAPQLALAAVQPELGAASFGFTPQGFDPAQAAAAMIAPVGGKIMGGIVERLATKAGISNEQALGAINRLGGGAGVASLISAPAAYQIAQMKPGPERDDAIQDAASNAILTGVLGSFAGHGERPAKSEIADATQSPVLGSPASEGMTPNGTDGPVSQKLDYLTATFKRLETTLRGNQLRPSPGFSAPISTADDGISQSAGDGPALSAPRASEPYYVYSKDGVGGPDDPATRAGVENYLRRQNNVPPVQIVNDTTWTHNGYGVRGTVQDGKIIVNRAFIDSAETLQKVLQEEHTHSLLSSKAGRQAIRYGLGSNLGSAQRAGLAGQYPIQPGESEPDYEVRLMDEFISKAASERLPVWNQIVERVKTWLASKGIGELSDEETARAIVRALKAGKTADETVPMLISKGPALFETPDSVDEFTEENSNLAGRYNLTDEPLDGISTKRTEDAINQLFGTKQLPAQIRVIRDRNDPATARIGRRGNIIVNAAQFSSPEQVPQVVFNEGLHHIWYDRGAQRALEYVRSKVTPDEMKAALRRRKAQGLPIDSAALREDAAIARVINSDGRDRVTENFHHAIRAAIQQKFRFNLPATAHPQLKKVVNQFLSNRTVPAEGLGSPPKAMVPLGQWGEAWLSRVLRGVGTKPSKPQKTSLTFRFVDRLFEKIAHESKAGLNVKLNDRIRTQILKDADMIRAKHVKGAHWHFFRGAQPDVLKFLEQNGIGYTVY